MKGTKGTNSVLIESVLDKRTDEKNESYMNEQRKRTD